MLPSLISFRIFPLKFPAFISFHFYAALSALSFYTSKLLVNSSLSVIFRDATVSLIKTSTSFYSEQLRNSFFVLHCFRKRVSLYSFCDSLECHEWSAGAHIRTLWAVRHAATFAMNTALVGKQLASPKQRGMYQAFTCNNPLTTRMRLDSTRSILFPRVFFPEGRGLRFLLKKGYC